MCCARDHARARYFQRLDGVRELETLLCDLSGSVIMQLPKAMRLNRFAVASVVVVAVSRFRGAFYRKGIAQNGTRTEAHADPHASTRSSHRRLILQTSSGCGEASKKEKRHSGPRKRTNAKKNQEVCKVFRDAMWCALLSLKADVAIGRLLLLRRSAESLLAECQGVFSLEERTFR